MKQETDDKKALLRRFILIAVAVILLGILNYAYFKKQISSNDEKITDYVKEEDPMEKYRDPAVAGIFYADSPTALANEVEGYLNIFKNADRQKPKILIVPHAGYQYSGYAAAKAYQGLKKYADKIKNVILLGPSHRAALYGIAVSTADYFTTPLGKIALNKEIGSELVEHRGFAYNDRAHRDEHSLEVQLPFLQKVLSDFKIIPLVYGEINPQDVAEVLQPYLQNEDTLLVVSADLSHYYPYDEARIIDAETAQKIENNSADIDYHHSCGAGGINSALILSEIMRLKPEILALINSGDSSGIKEKVVGYGAWTFAESNLERQTDSLKEFTKEYRDELLRLARTSLEEAVLHQRRYEPSRDDFSEVLFNKGATFVTLTEEDDLRGCIGTLLPREAVAADIAQNAYAAALSDHRFNPVTAEELEKIKISISFLTGYERVLYQDEEDLLNMIEAGTDGVVIRDGNRQGLFLPSVWKQIPDKKEFLQNLKLKAGMSPSYWSNNIKVYRFRTVEIKENEN